MLGKAPVNAVVFGFEGITKERLKKYRINEDTKWFISGWCGGLASSPIVCPVELLKVK